MAAVHHLDEDDDDDDDDDVKDADNGDRCYLTIQRQDLESPASRQKPKRNLLLMSVKTNEKWSTASLQYWQITTRISTINSNFHQLQKKQEICSVELGVCPMQLFHFWSRDVHPVQNLLLCTKFHEYPMNFSLRYGDISIFKMAAVRHLGIVLPPYETTHEVSVAGRSCLSNFMSIWYTDLKIQLFEFFTYLAWYAYSGPQNGGFGGLWTPKCNYSSSRPPKGTSLCKSTSFKLSTIKICWGVWPVCELKESVTDTQTDRHTGKCIFCPCIALDRQLVCAQRVQTSTRHLTSTKSDPRSESTFLD